VFNLSLFLFFSLSFVVAYESPDNVEAQEELQLAVKNLAGKITYALSSVQSEGHTEEISKQQPVVALPKIEQAPSNEDSRAAG
jgi:hypothetical protein